MPTVFKSFSSGDGEIPPLKRGQLILCDIDRKLEKLVESSDTDIDSDEGVESLADLIREGGVLYLGWLSKRTDDSITLRKVAGGDERTFQPDDIVMVFPFTIEEATKGGPEFIFDMFKSMEEEILRLRFEE